MSRTSKFYGIEFPDIQKIRANIVSKAIQLNHLTKPISTNLPISSLTSPHQSLISDEIVSATLEAIHHDFNFDRVILFGMSANRLGLQAKNCWPGDCAEKLLIPSTAIGGQLLQCFRNRTPVIINNSSDKYGQSLLNIMEVDSFIVVPVLHNNRLVNVLYADNVNSRNPIEPDCLVQMLPVANQLAIGLANAKQYQMAKDLAEIDALSQLFNKGKINQLLIEVYGHEAKKLAGFAIGFVDIDHFKNFNDVCGHQAGDDAIKIVAEILRSLSRPDDFVGRYGGEEFLFVLRNTNKEGAIGFAERMRLEIEKRGKVLSSRFNNLSLTVSIGIAMYQTDFLSYIDHVQAADKAMYQAKNQGRNRVIMLD